MRGPDVLPDRAPGAVADYLYRLERSLRGPEAAKAELLTEIRDSLNDAAEAYRHEGLAAPEAQHRAVAEFGTVAQLAPAYQDELATVATRGLALRTAYAYVAVVVGSVLMWWRAPWTGHPPPSAYLVVSDWVDGLGYTLVVAALATYGWLFWAARSGRRVPRAAATAVGAGTALGLALSAAGGVVLYAWSVRLWPAAHGWPPMLLGGVLLTLMYGWLGRTAWQCVRSGRA